MRMGRRLAATGAVALLGLGTGAAGAAAYSISGGSFAGIPMDETTLIVADVYMFTCPTDVMLHGGLATGAASTAFSSYYGGTEACEFFGFPATATTSGNRTLTVTSGPGGLGTYGGELHIPASWTAMFHVPVAGCTVTVTGTQNFVDNVGNNVVGAWNMPVAPVGMAVISTLDGVVYSASGCPFPSGSDGLLSERFVAPGITVS